MPEELGYEVLIEDRLVMVIYESEVLEALWPDLNVLIDKDPDDVIRVEFDGIVVKEGV